MTTPDGGEGRDQTGRGSRFLAGARIYLEPRLIQILLLGFASGLPLALSFGTLSVRLTEDGISKAAIAPDTIVGVGAKAGALAVICATNVEGVAGIDLTEYAFPDGGTTMKVSVRVGVKDKCGPESDVTKRICYPKEPQTFRSSCGAMQHWVDELEVGQKLTIAGVARAIEVVLVMMMHVQANNDGVCEVVAVWSENIYKSVEIDNSTRRLKKTVLSVTFHKVVETKAAEEQEEEEGSDE